MVVIEDVQCKSPFKQEPKISAISTKSNYFKLVERGHEKYFILKNLEKYEKTVVRLKMLICVLYKEQKVPTLFSLATKLSENDTTLWGTIRNLGFCIFKNRQQTSHIVITALATTQDRVSLKINNNTYDTPSKEWTDTFQIPVKVTIIIQPTEVFEDLFHNKLVPDIAQIAIL